MQLCVMKGVAAQRAEEEDAVMAPDGAGSSTDRAPASAPADGVAGDGASTPRADA